MLLKSDCKSIELVCVLTNSVLDSVLIKSDWAVVCMFTEVSICRESVEDGEIDKLALTDALANG